MTSSLPNNSSSYKWIYAKLRLETMETLSMINILTLRSAVYMTLSETLGSNQYIAVLPSC